MNGQQYVELRGVEDNKARQYVAKRVRGKVRKYVDGWARLEANNKRVTTTTAKNGQQYVDTWRMMTVQRGRKIC